LYLLCFFFNIQNYQLEAIVAELEPYHFDEAGAAKQISTELKKIVHSTIPYPIPIENIFLYSSFMDFVFQFQAADILLTTCSTGYRFMLFSTLVYIFSLIHSDDNIVIDSIPSPG
jgi:hypothetical protein